MDGKSAVRLSLYAGLSSVFVTLSCLAIQSFLALPALERNRTLQTIVIVSVGMLLVIEPLLSRIADLPHETSKKGFRVRFLALVVIILVSLSDGLLHEYIGKAVSRFALFGIATLVTSLIGPVAITFFWLVGVRKAPPRAKNYGLYVAVLNGIIYVAVGTILLASYAKPWTPPPGFPTDFRVSRIQNICIHVAIGLHLLWPFATSLWAQGFIGGLAVDRSWCRHAWQRIAIGLTVAAIVQSVSVLFVFSRTYGSAKISLSIWSALPVGVVSNIGWALGIYLVSDADTLFQTEGTRNEMLSFKRESILVTRNAVLVAAGIVAISFCSLWPFRALVSLAHAP